MGVGQLCQEEEAPCQQVSSQCSCAGSVSVTYCTLAVQGSSVHSLYYIILLYMYMYMLQCIHLQ